jgi:hypothetical protein
MCADPNIWTTAIPCRNPTEAERRMAFLEDENTRLRQELAAALGNYSKLYGCVRTYVEADPQVRGEAYRDLAATLEYCDGYDANMGWPACYQRLKGELAAARAMLWEAVDNYADHEPGCRWVPPDWGYTDPKPGCDCGFLKWYERARAAGGGE